MLVLCCRLGKPKPNRLRAVLQVPRMLRFRIAFYGDVLAGDALAAIGAALNDHVGDFLRIHETGHRRAQRVHVSDMVFRHAFGLGMGGDDVVHPVVVDRSRRDGVDADIVPAQPHGPGLGQADDRLLKKISPLDGTQSRAPALFLCKMPEIGLPARRNNERRRHFPYGVFVQTQTNPRKEFP